MKLLNFIDQKLTKAASAAAAAGAAAAGGQQQALDDEESQPLLSSGNNNRSNGELPRLVNQQPPAPYLHHPDDANKRCCDHDHGTQ